MPTSITVAPGLSQSPLTMFGAADGGDDDVGLRGRSPGRSTVRLWAMVTVQLSPSRSIAIGLPTMFERPMTTAVLPDRSPSSARSSLRQPERGAGHEPVEPDREPPGVDRVEAVDVLVGVDPR